MDDSKAIQQRFAHTLLSPLTVILGSLDMLLNQDTGWPDYAHEILDLAQTQAQHLHNILNKLLLTAEIKGNTVLLSWSIPVAQSAENPALESADQHTEDRQPL